MNKTVNTKSQRCNFRESPKNHGLGSLSMAALTKLVDDMKKETLLVT